MNKISLLVKEWYQTNNRTILKQIFEEIQESNVHFFGACFKTWTNEAAIEDANECIQRFCISLYEKLIKKNDPKPIQNFEHYCSVVRRRIFWNYKSEQQKEQLKIVTQISTADGYHLLENLHEEETSSIEDKVWDAYLDFVRDAPRNNLSYAIFKLRIEEKLNHKDIANYLNKKFDLVGDKMLNSVKVRKRYSKLLEKWRIHYDKVLEKLE